MPGGFLILKLLDFKEVNKEFDIENEVKKIVKEKTNQQLQLVMLRLMIRKRI